MDAAAKRGLYWSGRTAGVGMRTRGESPARGGSLRGRVAALLATTATLAAFAGCADDALDRAASAVGWQTRRQTLESLALDDRFFRAFEALRARAGRDPKAARDAARLSFEALGRAWGVDLPAMDRLVGGSARDPQAVATFLEGAARLPPPGDPEAAGLRTLAALFGGRSVNLGPAVDLALAPGPFAPGVRLLLAQRLLAAVRLAAEVGEGHRGRVLLDRMPGWPVPFSRDPAEAAFPHALRTLGTLVGAGDGGRAPLAGAYETLATAAAGALGGRIFAAPVTLGGRPVTEPWGARDGRVPLAVATLDDAGLHLGTRPALAWRDGAVVDLLAAPGFPGPVRVTAEALDAPPVPDEAQALARELEALAAAVAPIEALRTPDVAPSDRRLLVVVGTTVPAGRMRAALARLVDAGAADLRIEVPGLPGAQMPAYAFRAPEDDLAAPRRLRVLVAADGCRVTPIGAAPGPWPSADALPDGVEPVNQPDGAPSWTVPWTAGAGFGRRLSALLRDVDRAAAVSRVVEVAEADDALPAAVILDAAFEVSGFAGARLPDLETRFPGTGCPAEGPCVGGIPVLFGGEPD